MSIRVSAKTKEDVLQAVRSQLEQLFYVPAKVKPLQEMTQAELKEYVNRSDPETTTQPRQKEIDAIVDLAEAKLATVELTEGANQSIDLFIPYVGLQSEVVVRTERDGTEMKDWSQDGKTYVSEGRTFYRDGTPVDGRRDVDGNLVGPNVKLQPEGNPGKPLGRTDGLNHGDPKNGPAQDPNKTGPGPAHPAGAPTKPVNPPVPAPGAVGGVTSKVVA